PRDVAMLDGGDGHRLVLEALAEVLVEEQLDLQQLQRHAPPDRQVLGDEHLAHAALAERVDELVAVGQDVADEVGTARDRVEEVGRKRVDARRGRRGERKRLLAGAFLHGPAAFELAFVRALGQPDPQQNKNTTKLSISGAGTSWSMSTTGRWGLH